MKFKSLMVSMLVLISIVSISVFAYFVASFEFDQTINYNSTQVETEINSELDFYKYTALYNNEEEFNSNSLVSSNRYTLKLMIDITLKNNILISSDCNIDLNGHFIDLNGYNLTIRNQFAATLAIYDTNDETGIIKDSTGLNSIYIDCPNGVVIIEDNILDSNISQQNINISDDLLKYSVLKFIFSNIANYNTNDFYRYVTRKEDIINSINTCTYENHGALEDIYLGCIYTYTDLDLIYNYYTYDLEISYTSSDENIISNGGRIVAESGTAQLLISVGDKKAYVDVHIIPENEFSKASSCALLQKLNIYYDSTKYVFPNSYMLPKYDSYFKVDYEYELVGLNENDKFSEDTDYFDGSDDSYYILNLDENVNKLNISVVNKNNVNDEGTTISELPVSGTSSEIIDNNASYAQAIIREQFNGNTIIINKEDTTPYTEYDLLINPEHKGYSRLDYQSEIRYEIVNDLNNTYEICDNDSNYKKLKVADGKTPYITEAAILIVTFKFKDAYMDASGSTTEVVRVPIIYIDNTEGEGFASFDPYYVFFNKEFNIYSQNFTYSDFDIPATFGSTDPLYNFVIFEKVFNEDGSYTYSLITKKEATDSTVDSLFDVNIEGESTKYYLNELIANKDFASVNKIINSGIYRTNIDINPYWINRYDSEYYFLYVPVFTNGTSTINYNVQILDDNGNPTNTTYSDISLYIEYLEGLGETDLNSYIADYDYVSKLTIPGIIRPESNNKKYEEEAFADANLYKIVYQKIYSEDDSYDEGIDFILTEDISMYIGEIDLSTSMANEDITSVSSLKGFDLLIGLKVLNLNKVSLINDTTSSYYISEDDMMTSIGYISQMTGLEELYLSNTGIYDQEPDNYEMPSGTSNGILKELTSIVHLRILDISNNKIYEFGDLESFTTLERLDVSENTFKCDAFNIQFLNLGETLNNMFTSLTNSLYGSKGASNVGVLTQLQTNGTEIVNEGVDTTISPEVMKIVGLLASFEYQDKVSNDVELETILEQYSNENIYDLPNSYVDPASETEQQAQGTRIHFAFTNIDFIVVDDNTFTVAITYSWKYSQYTKSILGNNYTWSPPALPDDMTEEKCVVIFKRNYTVTRY